MTDEKFILMQYSASAILGLIDSEDIVIPEKLLDKRDVKRKDELWNGVMKSEKSYDEILQMIMKASTDQNELISNQQKTLFCAILTKQRF